MNDTIKRTQSDGQAKNGDDAVHGLVLPADGARAIGGIVPKAGRRRVETGSVLLHHHARDYVLERFLKLHQRLQARVHDGRWPQVNLITKCHR